MPKGLRRPSRPFLSWDDLRRDLVSGQSARVGGRAQSAPGSTGSSATVQPFVRQVSGAQRGGSVQGKQAGAMKPKPAGRRVFYVAGTLGIAGLALAGLNRLLAGSGGDGGDDEGNAPLKSEIAALQEELQKPSAEQEAGGGVEVIDSGQTDLGSEGQQPVSTDTGAVQLEPSFPATLGGTAGDTAPSVAIVSAREAPSGGALGGPSGGASGGSGPVPVPPVAMRIGVGDESYKLRATEDSVVLEDAEGNAIKELTPEQKQAVEEMAAYATKEDLARLRDELAALMKESSSSGSGTTPSAQQQEPLDTMGLMLLFLMMMMMNRNRG